MVIQVYALTSNAEEAEVKQLYEDLKDLFDEMFLSVLEGIRSYLVIMSK